MKRTPPAAPTTSSWRQQAIGVAGSLAVLCVFVAAVYVLHRELREYRLRDIEHSMSLVSWGQLAAAMALAATSFTLLTGYDWLAVHYIDRSLPYSRIALASFVSYVFSYNFGAILGGTTIRYRLYSTFGLSAVEIVKIIAICTLTFVLGFCTLAGAVFVFDPLPLPEAVTLPLTTVFPIGVGLLTFVGVYVVTSALVRRPIALRGWQLSLPSPGFTLMQMLVATADLMAAAGVLYVLLPADITVSYPKFLAMFLTAQVAGIASHVPGGLGVVEAVLLLTLGPKDPAALMASMFVYRLIYYLLPLVLATMLLAAHEGLERREAVTRYARLFGRWAPAIVPRVLAGATFAGGVTMLIYGALPRNVGRWYWVADFVPLPVVELSQVFGSVAGMGLLLLARGLVERLETAYHLSITLLTGGIVVSLLRGFNVSEALILGVMLAALLPSKPYFNRQASLLHEALTPGWMTSTLLVLAGVTWLGIFSHKHVEYSHSLWWQFALSDEAPRSLRATVAAACVLLAAGIARLLRPADPATHLPDEDELAAAARVAAGSPRAYANLALTGDKSLLFNADRSAFLMYAIKGASWVALGDPVGSRADAAELAWRFRELCDRHAGWPTFYQVAADQLPLYLDLGLSLLKLGEEARIPLADGSHASADAPWMRSVLDQATAEGYAFEPAAPPLEESLLSEVAVVSAEWLATHRAREKGFSLGFYRADYFRRVPMAVARRAGQIVGFASASPAAGKHELCLDLVRYRAGAPGYLMDSLLIELLRWAKAEGYQSLNLGLTPLPGLETGPLAPLWQRMGTQVFPHGEHFHSFAQLRAYNEKFAPHWQPQYLASPGGLRLPRILANVASLISGVERSPLG